MTMNNDNSRVVLSLDDSRSQAHFRRLAKVTNAAGILLIVLGLLSRRTARVPKRLVIGITFLVEWPRLLLEWFDRKKRSGPQSDLTFYTFEVYNVSSKLVIHRLKVLDIVYDNEIAFLMTRGLVSLNEDSGQVYIALASAGQQVFDQWTHQEDLTRVFVLAQAAVDEFQAYDSDALLREVKALAAEVSKS